jgi:ribonuclease P protein component
MAAVVAKAVARRSVDRHTLKRRILSVMRPFYSEERYVVVYAKNPAPLLTSKELQEELASLLTRSLR